MTSFNKEIHVLRLAMTTRCILDCRYCFVKKNNSVMSFATARRAIDFFMVSPGSNKVLIIYGGEPLLFLNLLKKIATYAYKKAREAEKRLIVSLGTNGILLDGEIVTFLKQHNVKIALSIDGKQIFHDRVRVFRNHRGSFEKLFTKIPLIIKKLKNENVCVLFGVLPASANRMFENFTYLRRLGFVNINVEPIQNHKFPWNQKQQRDFLVNLKHIGVYLIKNISQNNFIFLNSVNRELRNQRLSGHSKICPFYENLEIYPHGEMAFSPFLINAPRRRQYLIGQIPEGVLERYANCRFLRNNAGCASCRLTYAPRRPAHLRQSLTRAGDMVHLRNRFSIDLARIITTSSVQDNFFARYIREAKKRIFE